MVIVISLSTPSLKEVENIAINLPQLTQRQSLVTLSLEKILQRGHPRWVFHQREPSLVLAPLPRPSKGSPAIVLDGTCKKIFFFQILLVEKIWQLKKSKFSFSEKKDSHFYDEKLFSVGFEPE